jgi:RHS repeat-associated protein
MSQNGPPNNLGPTVTLTSSRGQQVTDFNQFAGRQFEQTIYNGAGSGQQVTDTVDLPWTSTAVVVNTSLNQAAYLTGTTSALTYTALAGVATREAIDNYTYNANGLQASDSSIPDTANTAESTCTDTTYAANAGTGLVNLPATVTTDAGACNASGNGTGAMVAQTENFYDGLGLGVAPTAGNLTKVEKATAVGTFDITTATFDQYGRTLTSTNPDGKTTTTSYTPATGAEPTSVTVTDPMTLVTTTSYDPVRDSSLTVTDPAGYQTVKAYDALGRVTSEWTPGNPTSGPAVDTYSYVVSNTAPAVTTEQVKGPDGNYLTIQTLDDSFGNVREIQKETASGGTDVTDTTYNSDGWRDRTSDPYYVTGVPSGTLVATANSSVPSQTGYVYDGDGRVIRQIAYKNGTQTWETDTTYGGNYITVVPPSGGTSQTTLTDGRGLTTAIYQYHSGVPADPSDPSSDYDATSYTYTAATNLASITDAAGNHWTYTYDLLGNQLTLATPDAGTTTSSYDPAGHLMSVTDARGKVTSYTYDSDGRKTAEYDTTGGAAQTPADEVASWTWDTLANGKLTSSTSFVNGAQYTESVSGYNSQGLPSGTSTVIPSAQGALAGTYTQQDSYAPTGQQTSYTDSAGGGLPAETVTTGLDTAGNPTSLTGAATYVTSLSYTNLGQPQEYTMGTPSAPVYLTDSWDSQTGRLTEQNTQTGAGQASIDDLHYAYDNVGNVISEADTPAAASGATDVQCFQNDYLGRLVQAWSQGTASCASTPSASAEGGAAPYWNSYTYDVTGDLTGTTATTPAGAVTTNAGTYPAPGGTQPHTITTQKVTTSAGTTTSNYTYDPAGHLTSVTGGGQNQAYTWNDPGQLTQDAVTPSGGGTAQNSTYVYDASGTLLVENDPGTTTLYLGDEELSLNTGTGTVTGTRYYELGTAQVATRTGASAIAYLAGDSQGTDSVAIDATTLAVTRRYYDPYGNPRGTAPASFPAGQKGFVGGTNDTATGLTNLGAREYQPALGSFLSTDSILDPAVPQDLNPYSYAKGNPATLSDPTGTSAGPGPGNGGGGIMCIVYAPYSPQYYRCEYKYYDLKTGCYSNNITAFHKCVATRSNSNASSDAAEGVKHCSQWDVPCQVAAFAAAGVAGGICYALLNALGPICSGVASGAYNLVTYLMGGNSHISAKQALIEFAKGFLTGALSMLAVAGMIKVAGLILSKIGVAAGLAAKFNAGAAKLLSRGSHSKQSFLSWINSIFS